MKTKILTISSLLLILLLLVVGCGVKPVQTFTYDSFKSEFLSFVDNFKSKNYTKISPEGLVVETTSFPDNKLDTRQADIIENGSLSPARYAIFYKSNDKNILVKVNFIYFPECNQKQFLTINSLSPLNNVNISEKYKDVKQPLLDEYLISMNGYLILINFVDLNKNVNVTNEYRQSFINSTLLFYKDFETALLKGVNSQ